jgi:hypothetical protein
MSIFDGVVAKTKTGDIQGAAQEYADMANITLGEAEQIILKLVADLNLPRGKSGDTSVEKDGE